jgi:hypothetical protein
MEEIAQILDRRSAASPDRGLFMSMVGGNPGTAPYASGHPAGPNPGLHTPPNDKITDRTTYSRARNALILGFLSIPLGLLAGIPAVFVGAHALRLIQVSDGALKGRGAAWCGIVLGCLSVATSSAFLYWVYR